MAGLFMASCYKIYFCYLWKLIFKVQLIDGFSVDGMKTGFKNNVSRKDDVHVSKIEDDLSVNLPKFRGY